MEIKAENRSISRSVAIIEHEYGDKLKALFDAFAVNTEKAQEQDQKMNFLENKIEKCNDDIYCINAKVQGI